MAAADAPLSLPDMQQRPQATCRVCNEVTQPCGVYLPVSACLLSARHPYIAVHHGQQMRRDARAPWVTKARINCGIRQLLPL